MIIIIGLGNPGKKFEKTRHNVGFEAVDKFAKENSFPEFELNKKYNSLVSEAVLDNEAVILAKPQTFMNESGKAAKELLANTETRMGEIVAIHDDIDLEIGKIKIVKERGSAGHKGVESIIQNIGNDGLIRFRIGIAPQNKVKAQNIVLKKFTPEEQKIIEEVLEKIAQALKVFIKDGLEKAMNEYNK